MTWKLVIIESPYAGDIELNLRYLRACMSDCIHRGEAPFASHALYTQPGVLRDEIPGERTLGIEAGFAWRAVADKTIIYEDLGMTPGMELGVADAIKVGRIVEYRTLPAFEKVITLEEGMKKAGYEEPDTDWLEESLRYEKLLTTTPAFESS